MEIRRFHMSDTSELVSLFYDTVHSVNKKDYSQEQLDAWAPKEEAMLRLDAWKHSLSSHITYVALINEKIVGFSDMTSSGHLDRLFVHKDFQRMGVASALVNILESEAIGLGLVEIDTEASITAKPFFEQRGYQMIESQTVERKGVKLVNYQMLKRLIHEKA